MKCPACSKPLEEIRAGDVALDLCAQGCSGIWFDWKELKKLDEPHAFAPEKALVHASTIDRAEIADLRACPRCPGEILCRRYYDIKNEVEIDQCLRCSGIFLDAGELLAIRNQYKTEEERIAAADAYLDSSLQEHKQVLELATAERLNTTVSEVRRIATDDVIESSRLRSLFHALMRSGR